jgi:hypothetical protein
VAVEDAGLCPHELTFQAAEQQSTVTDASAGCFHSAFDCSDPAWTQLSALHVLYILYSVEPPQPLGSHVRSLALSLPASRCLRHAATFRLSLPLFSDGARHHCHFPKCPCPWDHRIVQNCRSNLYLSRLFHLALYSVDALTSWGWTRALAVGRQHMVCQHGKSWPTCFPDGAMPWAGIPPPTTHRRMGAI